MQACWAGLVAGGWWMVDGGFVAGSPTRSTRGGVGGYPPAERPPSSAPNAMPLSPLPSPPLSLGEGFGERGRGIGKGGSDLRALGANIELRSMKS